MRSISSNVSFKTCVFLLICFVDLSVGVSKVLKSPFILGAPKSLQMVIAAMKLKDAYDQPEQHIKRQR